MDWKFKVSTGLKSIIGRELITNEFIAIFELVKNSYDAGAKNVYIEFKNIYSKDGQIIISDDGHGMDAKDIQNKWLFVAYSEKKEGTQARTYRDYYSERVYAGAKGVGRFSCDRLGQYLRLFSKKEVDAKANYIEVDWSEFETDSKEEFINVPIRHGTCPQLPSAFKSGTTIEIFGLRNSWDRKSLLELKKSLSKMVNPNAELSKDDQFNIHLKCDEEKNRDQVENRKIGESENKIVESARNIVNGLVSNYVFEALNIKTTKIEVEITMDGERIISSMYDRGVFLFKVEQKNQFSTLKNIKVRLFQLNRAAKINFKKIMGITQGQYGNIFIYKNGFRIMPYGEPGEDVFGIDQRKAQGWARNLGTRDLIGRIEIYGNNDDLRETTSRDGGLIKTPAYSDLVEFFIQYALRPLEKYVVGLINWGDPVKESGKIIAPEAIRNDILNYLMEYEKAKAFISIKCNPQLFKIVDEKKEKSQMREITQLKQLAKKLDNEDLQILAHKIEKYDQKVQKERGNVERKAEKVLEKLEKTERELETTHRQALFLRNLANPKYENAVESLHMINTYTKSIISNLTKIMQEMRCWEGTLEYDKISKRMFEIMKATQKISSTYNIVCHADYEINSAKIMDNIVDFLHEYIENAFFPRTGEVLNITIRSDNRPHVLQFNPMEFGILIENIIYNSLKARAHNMVIDVIGTNKETVISFSDDGVGLNTNVAQAEKIFELGYTTTNGSGIGLAHVKKIVEDLGGTVSIDEALQTGFKIIVRIPK